MLHPQRKMMQFASPVDTRFTPSAHTVRLLQSRRALDCGTTAAPRNRRRLFNTIVASGWCLLFFKQVSQSTIASIRRARFRLFFRSLDFNGALVEPTRRLPSRVLPPYNNEKSLSVTGSFWIIAVAQRCQGPAVDSWWVPRVSRTDHWSTQDRLRRGIDLGRSLLRHLVASPGRQILSSLYSRSKRITRCQARSKLMRMRVRVLDYNSSMFRAPAW